MANGHGGKRAKSGRKSTKHEYIDDGLISPLQLMLEAMRDRKTPLSARIDIAVKAAPYCHARLQAITADVETDLNINLISYLDADPDPESTA